MVCGGGGGVGEDECISTSPSDWAEIVLQTIVDMVCVGGGGGETSAFLQVHLTGPKLCCRP